MQSRDCQGPFNPSFEHVSRAATNDGTLNAIVNKSVCSVDVPLGNAASHHEDEMLSWLHYPVVDSLDRGYCSDIFGDLPKSSAQFVRHSLNELGLRPQNAAVNTGTPIFSGILSHEKQGASTSLETCAVASESTREAVESCGSGPVEASFRVAGADAVSGLGACQAAGLTTSHMELEVYSKLDSQGGALRRVENAEQPTCERSSAKETLYTQSESSQTLSQVTSQQEGSFANMTAVSCLPKPLDVVNIPTMPAGKHMATNFALFSRPAVESKASLHVLRESSGPTNIERVRQQTGQHGMFLDSASTCTTQTNLGAAHAKWFPPPAPLPPLLPLPRPLPPLLLPHCSSPAAIERHPVMYARRSPVQFPPPSSISESREEKNLSKDTVMCSRMSIMSAEKGAKTTDQTATSPSRCSGSSTERSGKVTENASTKRKPGAGDDSDYQSEYVEEMVRTDKKSPSNAKRMRTAEMHNQSERKRRVKINDKLNTLQQLIPNGNKPDKASLLDAVIEYIKLLQSQLQMISMRTGIGVPSWMIPNVNMQHVQMPSFSQMRLTSDMDMGAGLGMGMRMGMGMTNANVAVVGTGCTIVPMPLFPGPPPPIPHSAALQPAERMQSPGMMNLYVRPSHVQHPLTNQHVPMYNTLQPRMPPQQPQYSVQIQQSPQLPGSAGKRPFS